jgi:predicted LPLAT superfamily acyltransferase
VDEAAEMNHGGRVSEPHDVATSVARSQPSRGESKQAWLARRERGSRIGIRVLLLLTRVLGRRGARMLLWPIIFYFTLFAGDARRASRAWYERVTGASSFGTAYRHLLRFAEVALDRVFLVRGELDQFEFDREGTQLMRDAVAGGQGALLLGAHFGSFEAMRAASRVHSLPINILAHNDNARMIAAFLDEVSGGQSRVRVIEIDPVDKTYILEVKQRIDAGELVAVLGDRLGLNDRAATVDFFGAPARFPSGPYIMASALRCPVLLVCATYVAPRRYVLRCELLANKVELPRASREQAITGYVGQYAAWLERYARAAPDNWFNFFDFWLDSRSMQADDQRPH